MATRLTGQRSHGSGDEPNMALRWQALAHLASQPHVADDMAAALRPLVAAIPTVTGFKTALLLTLQPAGDVLVIQAYCGLADDVAAHLIRLALPRQRLISLLSPDFAIHPGRSYRIPPRDLSLVADFTPARPTGRDQGEWGPRDTLVVPIIAAPAGQIAHLLVLIDPLYPLATNTEYLVGTIAQVETFGDLLTNTADRVRGLAETDRTRQLLEHGMADMLQELNLARQGDLTVRAPVSDSALGPLADLFNQIVGEINGAFSRLRIMAQTVNDEAARVRTQTRNVRADTADQADKIAEVSATIDAIALAVGRVAQASVDAARVAEETHEIATEGRLATELAVRGMEEVREAAQRSSLQVKRLGEPVQEIEAIVAQLTDFSKRTNVLAVNAAIEATRAGEQGRGFAAIAQEIRTLALNSADAAHQMGERVVALQRSAQGVVNSVEDGTISVVTQSDRVIEAGATLQFVDEISEQIAELSQRISISTTEESGRISLLVAAMRSILSLTEAARDEVSQIDTAMEQLLTLVQPLRLQIGQFALDPEPTVRP